jgi:hypothetical protein
MSTKTKYMERARIFGEKKGRNSAEWDSQYWPGGGRNTDRDTLENARLALVGLEDGVYRLHYSREWLERDGVEFLRDECDMSDEEIAEFGLAVWDEFDQAWANAYYARAEEILLAVIGGAS